MKLSKLNLKFKSNFATLPLSKPLSNVWPLFADPVEFLLVLVEIIASLLNIVGVGCFMIILAESLSLLEIEFIR